MSACWEGTVAGGAKIMTVDRFNPMRASVRSRSALAVALVMTVCLAIVGAGLVLVLFRSLQSSAQGAAAARAEQISAQLRTDTPASSIRHCW